MIRIIQVWCHSGYVIVTMPLAEGACSILYDACVTEYQSAMTPEEVPAADPGAEGSIS